SLVFPSRVEHLHSVLFQQHCEEKHYEKSILITPLVIVLLCLLRRGVMFKRLVGCMLLASVFTTPIAAFAQVQVNQNFVTQGPAPAFGPSGVSRSADAPPNGNVTGAIGSVIADPLNANRFFIGTVGGGIWSTTNGGVTWTPLTDKQATLSIASLAFDPTDPNRNTLIAGTGLTANGSV